MGAQLDRLRYEVFQNLFYSPMNTGFLRPAVATALTVYGIETRTGSPVLTTCFAALQQRLPFTVLKLRYRTHQQYDNRTFVATALTVYGIETLKTEHFLVRSLQVATALTVYGIETLQPANW